MEKNLNLEEAKLIIQELKMECKTIFDSRYPYRNVKEFIRDKAEPFFNTITEKTDQYKKNTYLICEIYYWIKIVENNIFQLKKNNSYKDTAYDFYIKLEQHLNKVFIDLNSDQKPEINTIENETEPLELKTPKTNNLTKPDFSQIEISLLILYLKKNKVFFRDITQKDLAKCFSVLTGYSFKTLIQNLGSKHQINPNELSPKNESYDKLINLYNKLISQATGYKKNNNSL